MSELLVCEGVVLGFKTSIPAVTGTIVVNPEVVVPPVTNPSKLSSKVKTGGKKVYKEIGFTVTGATNGTCTQSAPFYGSITPDPAPKKVLVDSGEKPVRETDEKAVTIPGVLSGGGGCSISATVVITSPGQTKAKAE